MKKKMVVFYSLMFLPLVVVLIALQFLPELIPAHYDMNNQVTRWGSKYETLIFPVITVLFGYFMLAMAKLSSKQEENGSNNKNVCIVTGIASLALFNAMTVYFLYADFNSIEKLSSIALDLNQLVFGLLGVAMIILGNIMVGKAQTGRAERPREVQQLRAAVPAPGRLAHRTGAADKVVSPVESGASGV